MTERGKTSIYGEFVVSLSSGGDRPSNADRIRGARLCLDPQGRPEWVDLQFASADGGSQLREVRMAFVEALFLLSLLKSIQLDSGTPFPDDPRGS